MSEPTDTPSAQLLPDADLAHLRGALVEARRELLTCKASLLRSQSALRAIADGIAVIDMDGRITCLNPVAAHLTGWTEDESLGRSLSEVVHFTDATGRPVDVLSEGFSNGHDDIVSLVRRDRHAILVDGTVAQIPGRHRQAIGFIVSFRNVTAAARLTRELSYHANHDALTGLLNRRAFDAHLQRAVSSASELGCRHAMLYFDLDQFKAVNDDGGHVAGDELLRQLAALLRRQLRDHDTLARLGGDEFAVLLENCTAPHASHVAEKIRSAIEGFAFAWEGRVFGLGASIGQIEFADDALSAKDIVGLADRMCYIAKTSGRNQIASYRTQNGAPGQHVSYRAGSRRDEAVENGQEDLQGVRVA